MEHRWVPPSCLVKRHFAQKFSKSLARPVRALHRTLLPRKLRKSLKKRLHRMYVLDSTTFSEKNTLAARSLFARSSWKASRHIKVTEPMSHFRPGKLDSYSVGAVVPGLYGNFGNQVFEAIFSIYHAVLLGVPQVILQQRDTFRPGHYVIEGIKVRVLNGPLKRVQARNLLPTFKFSKMQDRHLHGAFLLNWLEEPYEIDYQLFESIGGAIGGRLIGLSSEKSPFPSNHLTVAFRGGDVFDSPPPPHYGQPPLSFLQFVVNSAAWAHIRIVTQDNRNPTLEAFINWLAERGTSYELLEQGSADDVRVLCQSGAVCAPTGSFVPAIVNMSSHIQEVWTFEGINFPMAAKRVRSITDRCGDYRASILAKNWCNTPEQVSMMMTYPAECLSEQTSQGLMQSD